MANPIRPRGDRFAQPPRGVAPPLRPEECRTGLRVLVTNPLTYVPDMRGPHMAIMRGTPAPLHVGSDWMVTVDLLEGPELGCCAGYRLSDCALPDEPPALIATLDMAWNRIHAATRRHFTHRDPLYLDATREDWFHAHVALMRLQPPASPLIGAHQAYKRLQATPGRPANAPPHTHAFWAFDHARDERYRLALYLYGLACTAAASKGSENGRD
jgi:hypothetical protein